MHSIRTALFCAAANFRKWHRNPTIIVLGLVWFVFTMNQFKGLTDWCVENGYRVTPWVVSFYTNNYYTIFVFVIALIILFSQAPFCDASAPFTMIRTGKTAWFVGQFLYILAASFVFVAATTGFVLVVLTPALGFSAQWGGVLEGLTEDPSPIRERGCNLLLSRIMMEQYTPIEATAITLLMMWLTAALVGTLVLCFNTLFRPGAGLIAAGVVAAWSWFSHLGIFQYGDWMKKTCVFHWCSLMNLQPLDRSGAEIPTAVWIQLAVIAVLSGVSLWRFSRRDTVFEKSLF